jgi:hypothetical protein
MNDKNRYERKFILAETSVKRAEASILNGPGGMMRVSYPARFVNNLYLDSIGFAACRANLDGLMERQKTRIRWYGDLFGLRLKAALEIKVKNALVGYKKITKLKPFSLEASARLADWPKILAGTGLSRDELSRLKALRPVLVNRYRRQYFESSDGILRATIDTGVRYYRWTAQNGFLPAFEMGDPYAVLELKYPPEAEVRAAAAAQKFNFRLTRHSKYVRGVETTRSFS